MNVPFMLVHAGSHQVKQKLMEWHTRGEWDNEKLKILTNGNNKSGVNGQIRFEPCIALLFDDVQVRLAVKGNRKSAKNTAPKFRQPSDAEYQRYHLLVQQKMERLKQNGSWHAVEGFDLLAQINWECNPAYYFSTSKETLFIPWYLAENRRETKCHQRWTMGSCKATHT